MNEPDPPLSGKELPTFKFELEKSAGKVIGGSVANAAAFSSASTPAATKQSTCHNGSPATRSKS
jgi:hypothetical protein